MPPTFPMLTATSDRPPMGLVPFRTGTSALPRRFNRAAWSAGRSPIVKWALAEKALVADRRARWLPTDGWHVMDRRLAPDFNLALVSPHYYPPATDWGDDYRFTGFTPWTRADDPLPAAVEEYLNAGEPPILVCLGTSAASAAPEVFDLAAGKPSVIVPALFDQLWHARRHEELGTGIRVRNRVTVAKLRTAIEAALTTETASHAREFGARLATEDGVANACNEIEGFLNRS